MAHSPALCQSLDHSQTSTPTVIGSGEASVSLDGSHGRLIDLDFEAVVQVAEADRERGEVRAAVEDGIGDEFREGKGSVVGSGVVAQPQSHEAPRRPGG